MEPAEYGEGVTPVITSHEVRLQQVRRLLAGRSGYVEEVRMARDWRKLLEAEDSLLELSSLRLTATRKPGPSVPQMQADEFCQQPDSPDVGIARPRP